MVNEPFHPAYGLTQSVSVSAVAASVNIGPGSRQIMIANPTTHIIFVRVNAPGQTTAATVADCPVVGGSRLIISRDPNVTNNVSVIAVGGNGTVYLCPGDGKD